MSPELPRVCTRDPGGDHLRVLRTVSQGAEASPFGLRSSTAAPGSGQGRAIRSGLLQLLLHGGSGSLPGRPWGAANGCHGAPGYAGHESLGSLSERHCWTGLGLERSLPSVLECRATGTPALVERSEVLWNVRLKDTEDVQAFLAAIRCGLRLAGLHGRAPPGARSAAGGRPQLLAGLGVGLAGR